MLIKNIALALLLLFFSSCRDEEKIITDNEVENLNLSFNCYDTCLIGNLEYNSTDSLKLCNDLFNQLGIAHNYYLERFIENFDFHAKDNCVELKKCILNANISLDNLPLNARNYIIAGMDTSDIYENLLSTINNSTIPDATELISYLDFICDSIVWDTTLHYVILCNKLNQQLTNASAELSESSMFLLKTFVGTLKASGEFWLPINRGGSGIGYSFIENLLDNSKGKNVFLAPSKTNAKVANALLAGASAMSFGMLGIAVAGMLCPPVGATALIICAAEAAAGSGLAAVITKSK